MTETAEHWQQLVKNHLSRASKPLIVILGPTASGKTSFSLKATQFLEGEGMKAEIVNADSRQLYKYLDIGTAKLTEEEMLGIPHHLLSVLDPKEDISIAEYKDMAMKVINDCHARGVVPLLVGGSMLYISALVDGLDPLPKANSEIHERLEKEWNEDDGWTLYDKLTRIDPETAKNFAHQNKHYVIRAMELWEMTGVPPSKLKKTIPPPYDILQIGMKLPRETLVKRIDERVRAMLSSGWIEEVEGLIDRGYGSGDPAMKSVGYKEIIMWLQSEERNMEELTERIASKTRQYAKRQMTWWNRDERIHWTEV